ncbi:hypothetical protein EJ05DRAFT_487552 [Pseudovirgaria hyperparasitica]|uniref:Uncharacterized protein n=1 Tax=Pseudovirgaria hyperparasitica TaxID=470096 RepID=A0A6A6W549_9PEZI|nr:uncharacterized protein EJ05DRAFT_487552 [Pseudovirgaria hyperparasitica]KAF2756687.1 hypothetical protein EJ05DRAFT_487552 [Pseudovirgaria hyperparasitica]
MASMISPAVVALAGLRSLERCRDWYRPFRAFWLSLLRAFTIYAPNLAHVGNAPQRFLRLAPSLPSYENYNIVPTDILPILGSATTPINDKPTRGHTVAVTGVTRRRTACLYTIPSISKTKREEVEEQDLMVLTPHVARTYGCRRGRHPSRNPSTLGGG